ncbi:MAG: hypothetical protein OHK0048_25500 [Rhodoferax sp.]
MQAEAATLVLDTNWVLDAFLFDDPATHALQQALAAQRLCWCATWAMRQELFRVLDYPKLRPVMQQRGRDAAHVLTQFDAQAVLVDTPARAPLRCGDPDDQKFIDLAVARRALLLSRDRAVLRMHRRLQGLGARAHNRYPVDAAVPV